MEECIVAGGAIIRMALVRGEYLELVLVREDIFRRLGNTHGLCTVYCLVSSLDPRINKTPQTLTNSLAMAPLKWSSYPSEEPTIRVINSADLPLET